MEKEKEGAVSSEEGSGLRKTGNPNNLGGSEEESGLKQPGGRGFSEDNNRMIRQLYDLTIPCTIYSCRYSRARTDVLWLCNKLVDSL